MQEYCINFNCIAKTICNDYANGDGCSETQCQFQYDCESCSHQDECEVESEVAE